MFAFLIIVLVVTILGENKDDKFSEKELIDSLTNYYNEKNENISIFSKTSFMYKKNFIIYESSLKEINKDNMNYDNYLTFCNEILENPSYCYIQLKDLVSNEKEIYNIDDLVKIKENIYMLKTKNKPISIDEEYIQKL